MNLAVPTVTETGFGPVTLTGVEVANVNAGGNTVTVNGTAQNDSLTYSPTGATAGTLQNAGLNTVFNFSGVSAAAGAFAVNGNGGSDQLTVNGTVHQHSNLNLMVWDVPHIISHLSQQVTVVPGDLIYTGTPEGVGPVVAGDTIVGRIARLGDLTIKIS